MKKANPDSVRDSFSSDLNALGSFYDRAAASLSSTSHAKADLSLLAEGVFVSASVLLEAFLSDLFIVYINRNASQLMQFEKARSSEMLAKKVSRWYADHTRFPNLQHIPVADLRSHLDSRGFNLTFKDAAQLKSRAQEWLVSQYSSGFSSLSAADERLLDAVRAVRDCLAHQSQASRSGMNEALRALADDAVNAPLARTTNRVNTVSAYLKATVGGSTRLAHYFDRLRTIGDSL